MTHILTVNPGELNKKVAEELKNQKLVQPTAWPDSHDWWYSRAAALLRSVAKLGPVGTEKLRTKYGSKKNRGHKPEHFYKASGSHIRKILQQLEKSGLIKQVEKGVHKGRTLTPKGTSFLDKIAVQLSKQERKDLE